MKPARRFSRSLRFCSVLALLAAAPTSKPAAGPDTSIAKHQYHFPAPSTDEWAAVNPDQEAENITFINKANDGQIQMQLLPKDASVDREVADNVAVAAIKQLKAMHAQANEKMVLPPKIERDKRFAICIHEKYMLNGAEVDRLHLYKAVGPRVLLLTANSLTADKDKISAIHTAGQDLLDAVKFNRKEFKKDN